MAKGRAIAHYNFSDDEYIEPKKNKDGTYSKEVFLLSGLYHVNHDQFFHIRRGKHWDENWYIVEPVLELNNLQTEYHVESLNMDKTSYDNIIGLCENNELKKFVASLKIDFAKNQIVITYTYRIVNAMRCETHLCDMLYHYLGKLVNKSFKYYPINKTKNKEHDKV